MTQDTWTSEDSERLYRLDAWGLGHFQVGPEGHVRVIQAGRDQEGAQDMDLDQLVREMRRRGVQTPILFRFDGILRASLRRLVGAFDRAREEYGYAAPYRPLYPIKVNQERMVVETLLDCGREAGLGLEVGSKAELLAAISLLKGEGTLIVCNGYKDAATMEMALLATGLGALPVIVIERASELETLLRCARRLGIRPRIGVRMRLTVTGAGRWMHSAGDRSKFGLSPAETVTIVRQLESEGYLDCLELLHFHIGSQITRIRSIKHALGESTRTLVDLKQMGAPLRWFDVGGGLGVDYDGTRTDGDSSRNYSIQEYANDVVYHVLEACHAAGVEEPTILSESGRSLTAHHSVLVTDVVGNSSTVPSTPPFMPLGAEPAIVHSLADTCEGVAPATLQESYHDLMELRERAGNMYVLGQIDLAQRARAEEFYWHGCHRILEHLAEEDSIPAELSDLEMVLADIYYLNLSFFQSIPDVWAINQIFPVLPIHRLNERPDTRAILADLTCDSDGMVDQFAQEGARRSLALHGRREGEDYDLAFFLVGAYQEILGDLHNLFGDTNIVHVDQDQAGATRLRSVLPEEPVAQVLSYVEYHSSDLLARVRLLAEQSIDAGRMSPEDSANLVHLYERILRGSTYYRRQSADTPQPLREASHANSAGL